MQNMDFECVGEAGSENKQDCKVVVTLRERGGVCIELYSRLGKLFGKTIKRCAFQRLAELGVENAHVEIFDNGCLDFGIRAHLETAVSRARQRRTEAGGDARRINSDAAVGKAPAAPMRSMLFCPADRPKNYVNAPVFGADCIIFDLEDAVSAEQKDCARDLLCEAARTLPPCESAIYVRINSLHTVYGEKDVRAIVPAGIRNVRLAMCQERADVTELAQLLSEVEKQYGIDDGSVKIQCSIETPKGVLNAREIAAASRRVTSLSFGAEDYTRVLGGARTKEAGELEYARRYLPVAAAEAGIPSIDTVWPWAGDMEGFRKEAESAKSYGFAGKSCIHPLQIKTLHRVFQPSEEELREAEAIVKAMDSPGEAGVIAVNGKMIDEPVLVKARKILLQAGMGVSMR